MPNTLTTLFTSTPASEPVESAHPNTGVYVLGTQLTDGTGRWQVVHTLVTKTSTPPTITGRQKNYPTIAASVVATGGPNNGNVFNNILATPTGTSAVASSATAINATVSSNPNASAYRLLSSATAGGAYAQLYQGTAAGFAHTGLTAGTTYYYEWQYVGSGYYDDSLPSASFSGATTAAAAAIVLTPVTTDYGLLVLARPDASGNVQRSFAATLDFTSSASSLTLTLLNTEAAGNAQPSSITLLQAGQTPQTVRPTGGQAASDYPLTLLGSAPFAGRLILGTLERAGEAGDILGRVVQKLTFAAGSAPALVPFVKQTECVVFVTDSIGTGTGTTTPETDGWLPRLRALDTGRDYLNNGYQSRQLRVALADSPSIDIILGEVATATASYTTRTLALVLGTNDYNQTPSVLAGLVSNFLSRARAQFPNMRLLIASPIVANSTFASESNLPAIRTALQGTVGGLANVAYVNGLQLLGDNTQLNADGVHPTANGHTIIASNWLQALQAQAGGVNALVDNSNITFLPNSAAFYNFHNTTVSTPNYLMTALNYVNNDVGQGAVRGGVINIPFNGTQALIYYHIESQGTIVQVLVDNVVVGEFNQYNAATVANYSFLTPKVAAGNHTLSLRKKNGADTSKIFWYEGVVIYGGTGVPASSSNRGDVTAFLQRHTSAGGSLTNAQQTAINTFVTGLANASILAKMLDFGLIIGGTAATHALGFLNVANTTWAGGVTHSATGALGDGTSGYGNLNINPSTVGGVVALNSAHLSYYSRQDRGSTQSEREMGVGNEQTGQQVFRILTNIQGGLRMEVNSIGDAQTPAASTAGYFLSSRLSSNAYAGYRNGAAIFSSTAASTALPNGPMMLLAQGGLDGTRAGYSTKECCFWSVGGGLLAADVTQINTLVQNLQSALGRAV